MTPENAELNMAARLLIEVTGCDQSMAVEIVDSVARYAVLKSQGCLPAGWGRRAG